MNNYQCHKCRVLVQNSSTPLTPNCPGGGGHSWTNLGSVGNSDYQCKKCSAHVKSNSTPLTPNCPSGGGHSWTKLT